jgi:predicted dehydrogenase
VSGRRGASCAVIGLGAMGAAHAEVIAARGRGELAICCDLDASRAAACPPGARFTQDVEEALAHPGLEAVVVATPEPAHRRVVEPALERGLAVLCEKPIAGSLEDADAMIAAAARTGSLLAVGHTERFDPGFRAIAEGFAAGELGEPIHLVARRESSAAEREVYALRTTLAVELAIHDLDIFRWLAGDVDRVYGETTSVPDGELEASLVATVRFTSGAVGALAASWSHSVESGIEFERRFSVVATRGSAEVGGPSASDAALAAELDHFLDSVRSGRAWPLEPGDARAALAAALAIDRSAASGAPVQL